MSSELAWEAGVLPVSNTRSIATAKAEGFTARSDMDVRGIFCFEECHSWLAINHCELF